MDPDQQPSLEHNNELLVRVINTGSNESSAMLNAELACHLHGYSRRHNGSSSSRDSSHCPVDFDTVLCWPETLPNSVAVQPCFEQLNGIAYDTRENASRGCFPNGSWDQYSDYTRCKELTPIDVQDHELTTIYFIGYSVSLVALLFAVYIFWRFKDLRCLRNTIHMNLMCSYILADFMWIFVYSLQGPLQANKAFCIFLIVLLHYFHLTNFFWMFVEGLYLYILVVKTFTGENIKPRIYAIIGWGGPILFVLIWGITKSFTLPLEDQQAGEMFRSCPWTSHPLFDWIYQGPAITVLIINVIFLCIIMWVLITKLRSANNVETQQYRKAAKALLVLIPLLGVTYVFVLVGPTEGISRRIYDSIRAILLSTQGFTVALFYCFLNADVKNTVRHHYNSWHTKRTLGSRRTRYSSSRDWSSQARDSLRLYNTNSFTKRGSNCSIGTTTTVVVVPYPKVNAAQNNKNNSFVGDAG